jgi:5,10-methylene-tetrahydrofolate dehydrogenase/methenyl tetrahydrofolate cyclohydrolase
LPLPEKFDTEKILDLVSPKKDVDGIHPVNIGMLGMREREPHFTACTPLGCLKLIKQVIPDLKGIKASVIGRSSIVGLPMALIL